jgi:hypothetical protein
MEIMTLYVMNVAGSASHQSLKDLPKSLVAGTKLVHIYVSNLLYNSETIITPTPDVRQMFHAIKQKNVQKQ